MRSSSLSAWFLLILSVATVNFSSGCAGKAVSESDAAALYQEAEDDIKNDHYQLAIDKLRSVKNKFPYSNYALEAQIRIGDVLFMQESFAEAAMSYETFRDLHPKHERMPYVMYRIAESYYKDNPGNIARDQGSAQKAVEAYNEFLRRFPNDPQAAEAKKALIESRQTLASKEMYIGDFYLKRNQPDSARGRYAKVVELFPDTEAAKEAQGKLQKLGGAPVKKNQVEAPVTETPDTQSEIQDGS